MRVDHLPQAHAPLRGLLNVLLRLLSLILVVGLMVAAMQALPRHEERPAVVAAAQDSGRSAQRAGPQSPSRPEQAQGTGPRVVYAGPIATAPAPQRAPDLQGRDVSSLVEAGSIKPTEQSGFAETATANSAFAPAPQTARDAEIIPPPTATGSPTARLEQPQVAAIEDGAEPAETSAARLVNINTATLEDLNGLRGARRIGRAIIRGRPYTSIEDLLKKRVLNRTTFNRVKDQITVN